MNKTSLSSLYRRMTPAHADLARMMRELEPASEALAADVSRVSRDAGHRRHQRSDRRIAATRRFGGGMQRWVAAAACLVAVFGAWTLHGTKQRPETVAPHTTVASRGDVIFSTRDTIFGAGMEHSTKERSDHLFSGGFSGNGG